MKSTLAASIDRAPRVPRPRLATRLFGAGPRVVTVFTPAGYGKTTLLHEVAHAVDEPAVLIPLDAAANDPAVMIDRISDALTSTGALSPSGRTWAEISMVVDGMPPDWHGLILFDDVQSVVEPAANRVIDALIAGAPSGVRLVVAARGRARTRLARMRAAGEVVDVTADDMAMNLEEATALMNDTPWDEGDMVYRLWQRVEGWPAAMQLARAATVAGADPGDVLANMAGGSGTIAEYLLEEVLAAEPLHLRRFLLETSILDVLDPDLCDAVRGADDSASLIGEAVRESLFVFAEGGHPDRYRYTQVFRDLLRAELDRGGSSQRRELHRRAAEWYGRNDDPESQVDHLLSAGDEHAAADVVSMHAMALLTSGRLVTVRRWIAVFPESAMTRSGPLALTAAWVAAFQGDIVSALRHADVAEQSGASTPLPDGTASIQAAAAILRSAVCTGSLSDAARQAERAIQLEPRESPWRPSAHLQLGTIRLIQGQLDTAEPELEQAAQLAAHGQPAVYASSVAYLAAIDLHRGMVDAAAGRARDVRRLIDDGGLDQFPPMAFPTAIVGYILARRHDPSSSDLLRRSLTLLDAIAFAFPPADAWIRTVIAEGLLKVGDDELARQTLAGARRLLTRYPMDGRLHEMVTRTEQLLDPARRLPDPLTPREQELLTMLVAVRSLSDIAEELVVSLNTVKTHVRSIYQKLGVNSRQDAIRRARELGLLAEGSGTTR